MNIYFDYDSTPMTYNMVGKNLSNILMRIKTEIMQLSYTITHNANRPMPEGYVLVNISGMDGSVKVFGFDEQFRKDLSNALEQLNLSKIIHFGSNA